MIDQVYIYTLLVLGHIFVTYSAPDELCVRPLAMNLSADRFRSAHRTSTLMAF